MKFSGYRFTNLALLVFVLILTLTGLYGLFWTVNGWMFTVHRLAGWGLIALLPWKIALSIPSLRRGMRPTFDRGVMIAVSSFLTLITTVVLILALLWKGRFGPEQYWLRQTAISWHWMLALGLLAPFFLHAWRRWPFPKKVDLLSRRAALRLGAVGGLMLAGYGASQALARWRELPSALRRFTGSREDGSYAGNAYPVTHTIPARPDQIDPHSWRLEIIGRAGGVGLSLGYSDLQALPAREIDATLDCTLGWFSQQIWRGIPLVNLLEMAGASGQPLGVRLESVTGYAHILPYQEAQDVILATHVGGEVLHPSHGFPVRAVVPSRRGWFWVKWLAKVEALNTLESEDLAG